MLSACICECVCVWPRRSGTRNCWLHSFFRFRFDETLQTLALNKNLIVRWKWREILCDVIDAYSRTHTHTIMKYYISCCFFKGGAARPLCHSLIMKALILNLSVLIPKWKNLRYSLVYGILATFQEALCRLLHHTCPLIFVKSLPPWSFCNVYNNRNNNDSMTITMRFCCLLCGDNVLTLAHNTKNRMAILVLLW